MDVNEHDIALRVASLSRDKQQAFLLALKARGIDFGKLPIVPAQRDAKAALSYAQARQWFLWALDRDSTAYHLSGALRLCGGLRLAALKDSFAALVDRHESLRTVFRAGEGGRTGQVIQEEGGVQFEEIDLSEVPESDRARRVRAEAVRLHQAPFDLEQGPLLRVGLIREAADAHVLVVVMHHIVSDGWSMRVIVDEFVAQYRARVQGSLPGLAALPIQYADYAVWQRNWLEAGERERQLEYWRAQLGHSHPVLQLPADHARRADGRYTAVRHGLDLPAALVSGLHAWAQAEGTTPFVVLLAAFQVLLQRCTGQSDIRVGVPIANRHRPETQGVVGFFVNTQVLRNVFDGRISLEQVCRQARQAALDAQSHQDLPFEQLVEALQPERNLGTNPLFQVMFNHQRQDSPALRQLPGLTLQDYALSEQGAQFELTLDTHEGIDGRVHAIFTYAGELFESRTIERMADRYVAVLRALLERPGQSVGEIELLGEAERLELAGWGVNALRHPDTEPVHRLIERQVQAHPQAVALVFGDERLSYAQLNERANRLAHRLIALGVRPEAKVGIAVERCVDMVVGLLAILKAGGAYVPLDPEYPAERLTYMVQDSGIGLLLTQSWVRMRIPAGVQVLELNGLDLGGEPVHDPAVPVHGGNLAYVIYTSGSTGRPKGVGIPQHALVEHAQVSVGFFGLTPADRMLQFATLNFDGCIEQLFPALLAGASIVLRGPQLWDSTTFYRELIDKQISVVDLTTAYWVLLVQDFVRQGVRDYGVLRQVHAGGEAMPPQGIRAWREAGLGHVKLLNTYGPTEATVTASILDCGPYVRAEMSLPQQMPVGTPLAGRALRVVDADLCLVPQGVAGELCIGAALLARGYLGRAGLSAQRFVADPFDAEGGRLYRTGDLVRWSVEGQLEYLGRLDHQVKIRGLRIELGEVEAQLLAQPQVREAVVVAKEGPGGARLVGYVSAAAGQAADPAALRAHLARQLPEYMVPGVIMVLEALPLNANGKVDRNALPEPGFDGGRGYEAPQGEAEEALARIWAEVLGVERVGRHDNFFELGGHSLLALGLMERMRAQGMATQVRTLFQQPELAAFAQSVMQRPDRPEVVVPPNLIPPGCQAIEPWMLTLVEFGGGEIARIEAAIPGGAANIQDIYPLAPLQEGILFHHTLQAQGDAYVTPCLLGFDSRQRLERFVTHLNQMIERHDVLRTAVLWEGLGEPVQVVQRQARLQIEWLEDGAAAGVADRLNAHVDPRYHRIDVRRAPMMRAVAAHDAGRWLLQLPSHHLVLDHTTMEQLVGEIALVQQGKEAQLPQPVPFRRFVAQARLGVSRAEHEAFFRTMLGDVVEPTAPFGLLDVQGDGHDVEEVQLALDDALSARIRQQAQRHGVSAASLFHLAWALVLGKTTARDDVVFGTVLFGRMQAGTGAARALGMFINTLPIRIHLGSRGVGLCLRQTHEMLTQLLHHEHASLSLAQRCSGLPGGTPLFSALLNYRYSVRKEDDETANAWDGVEMLGGAERTSYPVAMSVDDLGRGFRLVGQVRRPAGARRLCEYLLEAVAGLVQALAVHPGQAVGEIGLLSDAERRQLADWGVNERSYPDVEPVHRLIERRARDCPQATALVFGEERLSYAELDVRANRLAHRLVDSGVRPEVRVGIAVERSLEMVVGLLAILKAGGAYVPLDPEYPAERLAYMLEDSGIGLLLTQSWVRERLPTCEGVRVLELDGLDLVDGQEHGPQVEVHGESLAYVIYTSGSTGRPKGAANRHCALYNRLAWMQEAYRLDRSDTVLQKTPFSFDVSVWEFFWPLMVGARLVIAKPGDHRDPGRLTGLILDHRVTTLHFVPSMLQAFLAHEGVEACTSLRRIVCSGEALPAEAQRGVFERLPQAALYNLYGPTEAAIDVTHWSCSQDGRIQVPIGQPISGIRTLVLGEGLDLLPRGVAGELYLGGIGLARGYLGRAGLSAQRFVADPFGEVGGRLYRTGDLVRWNAQGQLEYLGRLDHQVKIRGFRIELGEVEAQLLAQSEVSEAVVVAKEGPGTARLVAYVSIRAGACIDAEQLRTRLAMVLPDYMVPGVIVVLEALPLTANGKVDRKALPEPQVSLGEGHEAPHEGVEQLLAAVWSQVLKVEGIGRHDNFFGLGGDSIISLQIVARLLQRGWRVTPRQMFEHQTIAALAAVAQETGELSGQEVARRRNASLLDYPDAALAGAMLLDMDSIEDVYPLAPTQEGMLLHAMEAPGSGLYVNQLQLEVGNLDAVRLLETWQSMVDRHEMLRTGFLWQGAMARPLQVVLRQARAQVSLLDWSGMEAGEAEHRLTDLARELLAREIDWLRPPLSQVTVVDLGAHWHGHRHRLIWTHHHILSDGWTDSRLLGEWLRAYAGEALPARPPVYGGYIDWLQRQDARRAEQFWRTELAGCEGATLLAQAAVNSRPGQGFGKLYTHLDRGDTAMLQSFAQRERVTLNTLVQAAWALLLQQHTGKDRVLFGATVAGRPAQIPGVEEMMGLFINTVPIPVAPRKGQSVGGYLREVQQTNTRLREYEHVALADIQRWGGSGGRPLFDSIIVFENMPMDETLRSLERFGLQFGPLQGSGLTGYAMDLQVVVGESLEIEYCYDRREFGEEQVAAMRSQMEHVLRCMATDSARAVGELGWLGERARPELVALGRNTAPGPQLEHARPARHGAVHHLIEQQAARCGDAIALLMGDVELSYAQLNARANRLAHCLRGRGVGPDVLVGVALRRSLDSIIGLLAVLKAGGAYLPIDPGHPADRMQYMIEDSGIALLLTHEALAAGLPCCEGVDVVVLEELVPAMRDASEHNPQVALGADHLAYVIYTSGSTGRPKGVAVAHGPLAMHCLATAQIYGIGPQSCELHFMSFSFDGAHERWLAPLCVGAALALRDEELWTAEQTYDALHRYGVTNAAFPPAYLGQIADWASLREDVPPVELYVFGGEAMPKAAYDRVRSSLRPHLLINGYGPTETVVTPLIWKTTADRSFDCAYAPIGRPVGERCAYVLDAGLQLLPRGMVGELYIGGYGLARGYLGRGALTAERFVANPFEPEGGRLYRTGDLVRWMEDGNIEYIGRADHQVKIRGFRIELGEIEARMREVAGVSDVAVIAHQGAAGAQLIAYVVPQAGLSRSALVQDIQQQLAQRLPQYMLPSRVECLPALPRLISGKLDRAALPEPGAEARRPFEAPRNPLQAEMARIWQQVLGVEQVGICDNFFELGGDSIMSLQVISRVKQAKLGFNLRLRDLMRYQTIEAVVSGCASAPSAVVEAVPEVLARGRARLGPIQHWFFSEDIPSRHHFNQSVLLRGTRPLDGQRLEHAMRMLQAHHEAFRLRFRRDETGAWQQAYEEGGEGGAAVLWVREGVAAENISRECELAQRSLDLEHGPLWRVMHLRVADGSERLLIVIHHLIVDGVSWRVLLDDLQSLYQQLCAGQSPRQLPRSASYKAWTEHLHDPAVLQAAMAELAYWRSQLDGVTDLPRDHAQSKALIEDQAVAGLQLDEALTKALLRAAPAGLGVSTEDLLLSALVRTIAAWTRCDDLLITLEGHGREADEAGLDLSRTVGWFTSAYPVRLAGGLLAADRTLAQVSSALRRIPGKGVGFGALRYLHPDGQIRESLAAARPRITFNYLGQFDQTFDGEASFLPASESPGAEHDAKAPLANWLEIIGRTYGGRFSMGWNYSARMFEKETMEHLLQAYRLELEAMLRPWTALEQMAEAGTV